MKKLLNTFLYKVPFLILQKHHFAIFTRSLTSGLIDREYIPLNAKSILYADMFMCAECAL